MAVVEVLKKENLYRAVEAVIMISIMALLSCFFDYRYALNDDVFVNAIISGRYSGTPDIHNVSVGTPLNALFCLLYGIFPKICWFGGVMIFCQFYSLYSVISLLWKKLHMNRTATWICVVALNVLFTGIMAGELVIVQYTYTAALLMTSAMLRLYGMEGGFLQGKNRWIFVSILFQYFFTYCLRTEIFLFLLPVTLLLLLIQYYRRNGFHINKREIKEWCIVWGSILCGTVVLYGVNVASYSEENWQEYKSVDEYRTQLYDFLTIPDYEENVDFYESADISKASYQLLQNYNFTLDDEITGETLLRVVEYANEQRISKYQGLEKLYYQMFTLPIREGLWAYSHRLLCDPAVAGEDVPWNFICGGLYILLVVLVCFSKRLHTLVSIASLFVLRSGLWMYLILKQRTPVRVTYSLFVIELVFLLVLLLEELRWLGENEKLKNPGLLCSGIAGLLLAGATVVSIISWGEFCTEYKNTVSLNEEWEELLAYCMERRENFYFMDVYSTVSYAEAVFETVADGTENYDICGGWLAKSPLSEEKYAQFGIGSVSQALTEQENVFFVAKQGMDLAWLSDLYAEQGKNVILKEQDSVAGQFKIYQLRTE